MNNALKILIVDDTITYRSILSEIIKQIPKTEIIGTASNGKIALQKIDISPPDLVLLDVTMPVLGGIETLEKIKKNYPLVEVVMISGEDKNNANLTVKALEKGAIDFVSKPSSQSASENKKELYNALFPIISLVFTKIYSREIKGDVKTGTLSRSALPQKDAPLLAPTPVIQKPRISEAVQKRRTGVIEVIALGVSTGGPNALLQLIPRLPALLNVPILAVQHMPPYFTLSLAERLNNSSQITVVEGKSGMAIKSKTMYIAPGGYHMVVRKGTNSAYELDLNTSPPVKSCRPSVDVLFRSINMMYPGTVLSVILTGMGNDGAEGVSAIRRKGGYSIVQDEKTSVVWGMPGAVAAAGDADEIIPLDKIANRITELVEKGAR